MTTCDVAIVGGGLGGLTTGIALARSGLEVTVLEPRLVPPRDHWGLTMWPPGTRTLRWLEVLDSVAAEGSRLKALRWYGKDGREWISVNLERMGELGEFVSILPSRLEAILAPEAERSGVRVMRGAEVSALERDGNGSLRLRARGREEEVTLSARLVLGADGPNSRLRETIGVRSWKWQPPSQILVTGIGGGVEFQESRQAVGAGWSGGCTSLGKDKSWVYATVHQRNGNHGVESVRAYAEVDPETRQAISQLADVIQIRPWSVRVLRWAVDGVILIGDAAHAMLPHLGLGGTLTLEDVPVLAEVVADAVRSGDTSGAALREFQRRRKARVSYARRISEMWAIAMTSTFPGIIPWRDFHLGRMRNRPELLESLVRELSSSEVPSFRTRMGVFLP